MTNLAQIAEEERTLPGGKEQAQCPTCGAWRPLFCLSLNESGEWLCDGDLSNLSRASAQE